ncbi:unnamed protein product [Wickerhamomyces anomalus]
MLFHFGDQDQSDLHVLLVIDPVEEISQKLLFLIQSIKDLSFVSLDILIQPQKDLESLPIKRFFRGNYKSGVEFKDGKVFESPFVSFDKAPEKTLFTLDLDVPSSWIVVPKESNSFDINTREPPTGLSVQIKGSDTNVMTNYGYLQLKGNPGLWDFEIKQGKSSEIYSLLSIDDFESEELEKHDKIQFSVLNLDGVRIFPRVMKNPGKENESLVLSDSSISTQVEKQEEENKPGFLPKIIPKENKETS